MIQKYERMEERYMRAEEQKRLIEKNRWLKYKENIIKHEKMKMVGNLKKALEAKEKHIQVLKAKQAKDKIIEDRIQKINQKRQKIKQIKK